MRRSVNYSGFVDIVTMSEPNKGYANKPNVSARQGRPEREAVTGAHRHHPDADTAKPKTLA